MAKSTTKSIKWHRNKIDEKRREYIRKRDSDWKGWAICISCGVYRDVQELQAGHYYSRIHDFTTGLGLSEENVNLQCIPCNNYKRGNIQGYSTGLTRKYGDGILEKLEEAKKTPKRYKMEEFEFLIEKNSL